jgi:hypothetical protein
VIGDVKTAHSRRRIVLATGTVDALTDPPTATNVARKVAGGMGSRTGLLHGNGGLLDAGFVTHQGQGSDCRRPTARPNARSPSYCCHLSLESGVHPKVVQDLFMQHHAHHEYV